MYHHEYVGGVGENSGMDAKDARFGEIFFAALRPVQSRKHEIGFINKFENET